jgi:hypothetical protein
MSTTTTTSRAATTGLVGGALYGLFPLAWKTADGTDVEFGSLSFVAVMASYWIFGVVAPALIVVGLAGLRRALGPDAGKVGTVGLIASMTGLSGMALGLGIELASISVGGGEVAAGHFLLLLGFLVHIAGSILLGVVLIRRNRDALSRTAGALLTLALPLGLGLGLLGSTVDPGDDTWFWAALSVPTGIAWVLLGTSLRSVRRPAPAEFAPAS